LFVKSSVPSAQVVLVIEPVVELMVVVPVSQPLAPFVARR